MRVFEILLLKYRGLFYWIYSMTFIIQQESMKNTNKVKRYTEDTKPILVASDLVVLRELIFTNGVWCKACSFFLSIVGSRKVKQFQSSALRFYYIRTTRHLFGLELRTCFERSLSFSSFFVHFYALAQFLPASSIAKSSKWNVDTTQFIDHNLTSSFDEEDKTRINLFVKVSFGSPRKVPSSFVQ